MGGIALVSHARNEHIADGFAQAVAPHYSGLVRRLTVVMGDHEAALDLAQETYLRAFRAWDRFDGTDVRAWLHTIGLRLAFNERSRRNRWRQLLHRPREAQTWVTGRDLDLHAALAELRVEHRAALLMNIVDGYTHAQIGEMLEVPAGTVGADAGVHGAIWISEDGGVTWRPGPEETAPAIAGVITTGGPGFVAVGQRFKGTTAEVWTSPDGHAWTRAPHDPTFENATIAAIASSPQGLVAVGSRLTDPTQPDSQQPAVWFSTDGLHWAAASLTTNGGVLTDVTTDMSGFIASGYLTPALGPAIWRSTDGKAWQSQPMQREAGWVSGSIVSGPLGVVAIGQRVDLVATIPTSRAWLLPAGGARDQSAADLQFTIGDLAALPDRFVGTANCGPTADCSSDMIVIGKPAVTQEPSPSPRASGWTLASASASPKTIGLSRDDAVATARQFAGVGAATPTVDAESGPFSQFEPDPNQKNSPPSPDHLVWRVGFASSDTTERIVIIDYYTGALIQTSAAAR